MIGVARPTQTTPRGYASIRLTWAGRSGTKMVAPLVAEAFLGERPSSGAEVNHIDGDKSNNRAANLEWTNRSGNMKHLHGVLGYRNRPMCGEANGAARLTVARVKEARALRAAGWKLKPLAERFGISVGHASEIVRGLLWRSV